MNVWVVCCNDFTDSVHSTEERADRYVQQQKSREKAGVMNNKLPLYWHTHGYAVDKENI